MKYSIITSGHLLGNISDWIDDLDDAISLFNNEVTNIIENVIELDREYNGYTKVELIIATDEYRSITLGLFELPEIYNTICFIDNFKIDKMFDELVEEELKERRK